MPSFKTLCQDTSKFCLGIYSNAQISHINWNSSFKLFQAENESRFLYKFYKMKIELDFFHFSGFMKFSCNKSTCSLKQM